MNITADPSAIIKRLNEMLGKLDHFKRVDIGQELSAWQTEDMHRHRPFTMRSRRKGQAATVIRPHSLYEIKHSERYQRRMARRVIRGTKKSMAAFARWEGKTSMRPILRAELYQRLQSRMDALLNEKLTWK
jgi:hypothetical protein